MVRLSRIVVPIALVGLLVVPGLLLSRIYAGDLLPRLLVVAAVGSVGISVLVRALPAWTAAPASIVGLTGLTLLAVRLSAASGQVSGALPDVARDALRNSIPRLLTAMIPIEPQPDTVLVPVIATWLAGLTAAELGVRYQRVLLSYAAPALLFGGALYLVGPNARPTLWLPLAFAGCAALGLIASARGPQQEPELAAAQRTALRIRLAAGAAVGLAAIVALATALGPSVAGRVDSTPTDPRRYVTPPRLDSLDENPLVRLSGWALSPDQHLFDATVSGTERARIRLAVLNDYDGVTWRVGATYRNAGRVLTGPPAENRDAGPGREVEQRIVVAELDGRLLPGAATPQRIDGVRIAYDEATGTMALPEGLSPGVAYTVVSRVPKLEVNLLPGAEVPTGEQAVRFLALPGKVPSDVGKLAQQLGSGISSPYQRALAVEQFLAEHYALVTDAPSGHAYPNLGYFLFGPRNAGGQRGTSEQFAAAFALLARSLGLPTRLAVGFTAQAGPNKIRGANAIAWPEVFFTGVGWVDFNPLPQPNTKPRPVEEDFRPQPDPSNPPPPPVATPSVSTSPRASAPASAPADTGDRGRAPAAVAAVAAAGLSAVLLIALASVPLLRLLRRRRRLGAGPPADRITGAWREVLDALRLAGRPAGPQLAATEIAAYAITAAGSGAHSAGQAATTRPPTPPIDDLATLANAVAFAGGAVGEEQARRAVAQATAYVADLRSRRPWWRRLLWTLDPRPLLWKEGPPVNASRGKGGPS